MSDCRDCVHHGKIVLGKLVCHGSPSQQIEPDLATGGYPYANECSSFKDWGGNRNPTYMKCKCGNEPIVVTDSTGTEIRCTHCGHTVKVKKMSLAVEQWNTEVIG